ncbi:hypothetical protein D5F01_LYC11166 [Larimichthys crocea]|uniref:LINE-1 type transposase domain-containing protein 1 n=1 Tax=Larimichthys crocea TaxID=215358 RepID=A0A6G0ID93_LARCR|nr:hypothetical protein D5F01_LYC11166 [Larimichthys crocea]
MQRNAEENVEWPQSASSSGNANANSASGNQLSNDDSDSDMEVLPSALEKVSDKILGHMNGRFDKLEETLQAVQRSQKELLEKVETVEEQVLDHESHITSLEKTVSDLKYESNTLKLKVDDLEAGAKPHAIIARVHFYREKEFILRLRRERQLEYKGNKVLIFPDYTAEVMRQWREYTEAQQRLRELKVEHSLLFPARLRIKHNDRSKVFSTPSEAMTFINTDLKNLS